MHHRRSIRLKGHDYSREGAYFVTVVVHDRELLLSNPAAAAMIQRWWDELPRKFPAVDVNAFVVMPNHVHGIIVIGADLRVGPPDERAGGEHTGSPLRAMSGLDGSVGADLRVGPDRRNARDPTLGRIIQWFKTMTTNEYIRGVEQHGWPPFRHRFWQRSYYEHVIRDEEIGRASCRERV